MRKALLLTFLTFFPVIILNAQTANNEKAEDFARKAVMHSNQGHLVKAEKLIDSAMAYAPGNIEYKYEKALICVQQRKLEAAQSILEPVLDHKDINDKFFQILGKSYYFGGNTDKAMDVYQKGLEEFPNSGRLHLEIGNLKYELSNSRESRVYWENGVKLDPSYPDNYYMLSIYRGRVDDMLWSIIYGEIFINLSGNLKFANEISFGIYNSFNEALHRDEKGNIEVKFSKIAIDKQYFPPDKDLNFEMAFFKVMSKVIKSLKLKINENISIAQIIKVRKAFIKEWYKSSFKKKYPNVLFDFQKALIKAGHFDAYCYFIFKEGNIDEFEEWIKTNNAKFMDFANWYEKNRLSIDLESALYRTKFE